MVPAEHRLEPPRCKALTAASGFVGRAAATLRGFFHIMPAWDITEEDARILLGRPAGRTCCAWRAGRSGLIPPGPSPKKALVSNGMQR